MLSTLPGNLFLKPQIKRRESKKQKIADVAAKLFIQKGYNETTLDEISQMLKISKASIYTYVKSKQDIVFLILEQVEKTWGANFERVRQSFTNGNARSFLKENIKAYIEAVDVKQNEYIFLNHVVVSLDKVGRRRLLGSTDQVRQIFKDIILTGVQSGEFSGNNIEITSFLIMNLSSGWARDRWFLRQQMNLNGYSDLVTEIAIRMLEVK